VVSESGKNRNGRKLKKGKDPVTHKEDKKYCYLRWQENGRTTFQSKNFTMIDSEQVP